MDVVVAELNERYRAYKMLEVSMIQKKARLLQKIPELKKNLDIINLLMAKRAASEFGRWKQSKKAIKAISSLALLSLLSISFMHSHHTPYMHSYHHHPPPQTLQHTKHYNI